jgi:hypothetical protein
MSETAELTGYADVDAVLAALDAAGTALQPGDIEIIDALNSTSSTSALSANQGKALNDAKLAASGGTLTNVKETRYAATTSGNVTLDLANGNLQRFILGGNHQFTMPADPGDLGQSFTLIIECATYTPTWNSSPAIKWLTVDNTAPTLTTTADKVNVLTFIWDDTDSRWLGFVAGVEL